MKNELYSFLLLLNAFFPTISYAITLKEKIGQMLVVGFNGKSVNENSEITTAIEKYNIGGVILFDNNVMGSGEKGNIESSRQITQLNRNLQQINLLANQKYHRPKLPLFIAIDYEGGKVERLKVQYGFPPTLSARQVSEQTLTEASTVAREMQQTLKISGFNLNFAPLVDLNINPENPIISQKERSFSADPAIVSSYAGVFSKEYTSNGILCAYKHFPGHGSSAGDTHLGFVDVTNSWQPQELLPYLYLLSQTDHCDFVMTAHIINRKLDSTGTPATLSQPMLTGLLRQELKFDGIIITDDMQMKAITNNYSKEEAITRAINAGADMMIFANQIDDQNENLKEIINLIYKKIKNGEIQQSRIEDAYRRINRLKRKIAF